MTKFPRLLVVLAMLVLVASVAFAQTQRVPKLQVGSTAFDTGAINLAPGTTAARGIYFGDDVTLYRSAANTLKTDDSLTVTGTLTIGTFSFTNATASGTWDVTGATTLDGAVTLGDAAADVITVTGTPVFAEAATFAKTLDVTGATTLDGAVTLGDAAADAITVTGTATFAENVTLTGGIGVGTTLDVTGATTLDGAVTLGDAATDVVTVTGRLILRTLASNPLDATPADRPAGSAGEIAIYSGGVYLCTDATEDAEVWVKVGPA